MFTDLDRQQLIVPLTLFAADLSSGRSETVAEQLAVWRVLTNSVIVGLQVSYTTESGTSPQITITLERGTTVLATAIATANGTPGHSGVVDVPAAAGETLNVKHAAGNTDNAFEGLVVIVEYRPLAG